MAAGMLFSALFGSGLDYFAMADGTHRALAVRHGRGALNGLSGASMATANAYIADITAPEKREPPRSA